MNVYPALQIEVNQAVLTTLVRAQSCEKNVQYEFAVA